MFRPHEAIIRQLSIGGNHHASVLPRCYCMSSYLRNVRSHLPHAIFMYGVHVVFLVRGFLRSGMCPLYIRDTLRRAVTAWQYWRVSPCSLVIFFNLYLPDDGLVRPKHVATNDILWILNGLVTFKIKVVFAFIDESEWMNEILMQQDAEI
jgi:hypothetical protein